LGSGKTSFLQRVLEIGCKAFLNDPDNYPFPFYVPLGRYKQHSGNIEQMLMSEFQRAGQLNYPSALVRHFLDTRRILLLLDGLDEIHPIQNSNDVLDTVTSILAGVGTKAAAVLTCRRQFLEPTADELAFFGSYTYAHLEDVQVGLERRLRNHPTTYIASINPFDRKRIDAYLQIRCKMSEEDVEALFARFYGFKEMATTPVLLAMIATTVEEGLLDPVKQDVFPLVTLYEAYTNRWLERDVGRARLSPIQRRRLSEALADHMLWESKDSASWSVVREIPQTEPAWKDNPLTEEEAGVDIRNSGFLVRDLDDRYRFIHRSIMEFFAAKVQLDRLSLGDKPRHIPTDGFRMFLSILIARKWTQEKACPIPPLAWDQAR
jgi:hypothetical protein